jgi:ribosomal protein L31E
MLSFDWIEDQQYVGIDYLESKLPSEKTRDRILYNLNSGIKVEVVLKNHINYCKKHNFIETREHLFNIIKKPEIKIENRLLALETVADFPDSTTFLEEILDIDEVELFIKSAEILITRGNNKGKEKLLLKLSSEDEKFALESAKLLIREQDLKAIRYYSDYIKRTKKFEVDFHDKNPLRETNTIKALPILIDLLKFSYKYRKEIQQSEFDSLDNTVISILKNIALQNFSNKDKVVKALRKFMQKHRAQFEGVNYLNAVCDDIQKTFLINYTSQITVKEAVEKIKRNTGLYE